MDENRYSDEETVSIIHAFYLISGELLKIGGSATKANELLWASRLSLQEPDSLNSTTTSMALALRSFQRGVAAKTKIGLESDVYQKSDFLNPLLGNAFQAGQIAAKMSWFSERGFLNRLFRIKGFLTFPDVILALSQSRAAHQAFVDRFG